MLGRWRCGGAAWTDMLQLMDLTLLLDCWEDVPALFFHVWNRFTVETTSFRFWSLYFSNLIGIEVLCISRHCGNPDDFGDDSPAAWATRVAHVARAQDLSPVTPKWEAQDITIHHVELVGMWWMSQCVSVCFRGRTSQQLGQLSLSWQSGPISKYQKLRWHSNEIVQCIGSAGRWGCVGPDTLDHCWPLMTDVADQVGARGSHEACSAHDCDQWLLSRAARPDVGCIFRYSESSGKCGSYAIPNWAFHVNAPDSFWVCKVIWSSPDLPEKPPSILHHFAIGVAGRNLRNLSGPATSMTCIMVRHWWCWIKMPKIGPISWPKLQLWVRCPKLLIFFVGSALRSWT